MCEEYERKLLSKYSNIKRRVIGYSALSRKLVAYTVGGESGVLMCGAFHGMERITAAMLYRFLGDVCCRYERDSTFKKTLDHTGCTIVPMVNPDGVEISVNSHSSANHLKNHVAECLEREGISHTAWQANARGVDINHNFDADFHIVKQHEKEMGIVAPSSTRYGGEYPESERETRALCDLCRQQQYSLAAALHSQGREIYYDFGENTPKESIEIANNISKLSGYAVSYPQGIAVGGGFKDWFIQRFCRPAFTIEVGLGKNPLPPEAIDTEYLPVAKMLWYLIDYAIKSSPCE